MLFNEVLESFGNSLRRISQPASREFEIAALMKHLQPQAVLFEREQETNKKVAGNLFCDKKTLAEFFHIPAQQLIAFLANAIDNPTPANITTKAPSQEVVHLKPNLSDLPILTHFPQDGGPYITSGVVICRHPKYGQNLDFHRMMVFDTNKMAVRVVHNRHFDLYLQDLKEMEVAVCVGVSPNILLAAATSVGLGMDELHIANAIQPLSLVKAKTVDLFIPAESEYVIEGKVSLSEQHPEGPFVDLTETMDIVRQQPVMTVTAITHREDPIWQVILPGGLEHKLLMGMPREPTIFRAVNQVVRCLDVYVNPGGCSWLHAIVKIEKNQPDDGIRAIHAAFEGHRSLKHVFVVDQDIDIYNPLEVEWAMATRFQGDRGLVIYPKQPGSSLDPSAMGEEHLTTRVGFDLTCPPSSAGKIFHKVAYPPLDLEKWLSS
ncbi:MAG: UbiD family decarboxylase [Anaerolineales bacterium]